MAARSSPLQPAPPSHGGSSTRSVQTSAGSTLKTLPRSASRVDGQVAAPRGFRGRQANCSVVEDQGEWGRAEEVSAQHQAALRERIEKNRALSCESFVARMPAGSIREADAESA